MRVLPTLSRKDLETKRRVACHGGGDATPQAATDSDHDSRRRKKRTHDKKTEGEGGRRAKKVKEAGVPRG